MQCPEWDSSHTRKDEQKKVDEITSMSAIHASVELGDAGFWDISVLAEFIPYSAGI